MTTAHGNSIRDDNSECVIVRTAQTLFNTDYGFCSPPRFAIGKLVAEYADGNSVMFFTLCSLPSALYIFSFNMAFAFVSPDLRWCSKRIPAVILRVLEKFPSKGENSNSMLE